MNSSRMMTIATSLLLFSSSSPAFPDEPARNPEAVRRPVPAAPKVATQANHTSPSEPARLGQEEWPTWLEALAETQATGRPTVIVVTSLKASRSMSYVQDLRGDRSLAKLRLEGGVEFAELLAEDATEQVSRLRIGSFPTIIAYRRGARGLEAAGRHQGIMAAPQLFGWLQGLGLVPAQEDGGGPAGELGSASNQDRPEKARTSNKDQSLKRAAYDDIYATPQGRMYAPPPQYQAPPSYGPPSQAAPPQMAPPQQQAPNYQILTLPQAAPPQAAPLQAVPVTINVPQQMTVNVPQQALILQQAPQQAAPLNLLSVAAAPTQPVAMAAPTQAAPTQAYVMAAPTQVAAAPTQMVMAAPTQMVAAAPTQMVMAAPTQMVMAAPAQMVAAAPTQMAMAAPTQMVAAAPTQMVAAAPGAGVGISLPGLNLPGMNLSLQPAGVVGRFVGRIGKKLHTMSYPRVAIDIEAAQAAAELGEIEYVVAKQPPKRVLINAERPRRHVHEYEEEEEAPPPPRRGPAAPYYNYGPQPSPQYNYPPLPSVQRP